MKADADNGSERTPARRSQKEATRQRVLAAARELFDTHGYQGTTIREIARHAGVAVGSVFTTFASKGEILSEVMQSRLDRLYGELDRVMPHLRGSTADRLRTMFAIHFNFEAPNVRLFLSHIAAAYDWTLPPTARPYGRTPRLQEIILECLDKGVHQGDVRPEARLQDIVDLLMSAYAWTYRLVVTEGADAKRLTEVMDRQIGLIAEGFQPR
ncbi:transcriptional regulator, TetR family [Phenylobacterium zucineum HLK1]|uniref:Transcriptional regulator, TetR family n=1 Tax=Phenylobacterium zucineum (strain HLK1) TaxID=450851 RepID=B4RA51_PHEZH|nr:TetR/AcrR family transcriptional regulator [Phenylobacterium zucineum]ACG79555.1 transcriptional regulator, TetR family [Phenylobacterium zucineum HLK1]